MSVAQAIKDLARSIGFDRVGVAAATDADGFERLTEWLARGFAGDMAYMHKHAPARRHPSSVLPGVRSVVMVSLNYRQTTSGGPIAQYARGLDYHDVLRDRLNRLLKAIQNVYPEIAGRGVVDTAPLLERDFARRAGLGWFGKNTMLIHPTLGSFFFLGALLLDVDLPVDEPFAKNHCGTCTRCLDACPTDAFPAPGWLDSRRCISYLTIEQRGSIPDEFRSGLGDWAFGCDICQDVCPWNKKAPFAGDPAFAPREDLVAPDLLKLLEITEDEFRRQFRGTALLRTKRVGLVRNVALVLGNLGDRAALPALRRVSDDPDPILREAAAWAIAKIAAANDAIR
ncbi:MAG: tRNA epoxyqueuosine(34) reductase QueG [Planctomycetota bacterium]